MGSNRCSAWGSSACEIHERSAGKRRTVIHKKSGRNSGIRKFLPWKNNYGGFPKEKQNRYGKISNHRRKTFCYSSYCKQSIRSKRWRANFKESKTAAGCWCRLPWCKHRTGWKWWRGHYEVGCWAAAEQFWQCSAGSGYIQQKSNWGWYLCIQPFQRKTDRKLCRCCRKNRVRWPCGCKRCNRYCTLQRWRNCKR